VPLYICYIKILHRGLLTMNAVSAARNPARRGAAVMVLRMACRVFVHVVPLVILPLVILPSRQSIPSHARDRHIHASAPCLATPRERVRKRARERARARERERACSNRYPLTHARTLTRAHTSIHACLLADDSARTSSSTERDPNAPEASGI